MAEETPSLHIDTDWKKQAQEEKRRLAEAEAKKKQEAEKSAGASAQPPGTGGAMTSSGPATSARGRRPGEAPIASFASMVQAMVTQAYYYLGDMAIQGSEPTLNFDMAKYHLDSLGVLELKTAGNLTPDEKILLDAALYETRMRYISVASQYISQ